MSVVPKVIHYCWFGGSNPGEQELACMNSWKSFCPDYEIKRWDETNFDVRSNQFISDAYDQGKWAFVSDYARFRVLYDEGGVYLDTDVELIKPLGVVLEFAPYMGYEQDPDEESGKPGTVNAGLGMAFPAHHPFVKSVLEVYEGATFPQGENLGDYTVVEVVSRLLLERGLQPLSGIQVVDDVTLLPRCYLDPMDRWTGEIDITPNTVSIHRYRASWVSRSSKLEFSLVPRLIRMGLNRGLSCKLAKVFAVVLCFDVRRMRSFLGGSSRGER